MGRSTDTTRTILVALTMVSLAFVSGCESTSNWLKGRKTAEAEPIETGAPETNSYLTEMHALVAGDPATQAEIYADAKARAELTPDPSTKLRYALVLAAPGHSGSDPIAAQNLFRELLSQTELMEPGEVSLATIHLQDVEARIMLGAETNRLRTETSLAASTEQAAIAQRIATVEAENRRLRQSLSEAESKIDALSEIERSIREQAAAGEQ